MPRVAKDGKWRLVEGVVEALERGGAPQGSTITRNVAVPLRTDPTRTRQVDVHVAIPAGPRTITVGIEVKAEGRPLTVEVVEQIDAKLGKLQLDRCCLVSLSGFSADAKKDAVPGGLELLTLDQLDSVSWWHGALVMWESKTEIEVVHVRVDYDSETRAQVEALLRGLAVDKLELVDSGGDSAILYKFGIHHGIRALEDPEVAVLENGACFSVQVVPPPQGGETRAWAALRHGDVELPPPSRIVYGYRLHRSQEARPLTAYGLHGSQALTTSFPFVVGKEFQLTFVGKEGEIPGTVGELKMVTGPVKVPKTKV